jgi:hypothetical protein
MSHFLKVVLISIFVVAAISLVRATDSDKMKKSEVEVPMSEQINKMDKFEFLLGDWNLEYRIPKSAFSEAATGSATGTFKRALDDKYVFADYSGTISTAPDKIGKAHGIFAWDEKSNVYRYWWFESSGSFTNATCNFVNDETLFMNWHDSLFIQTFQKVDNNKVILRMEHPNSEGKYGLVMEVIFTRK